MEGTRLPGTTHKHSKSKGTYEVSPMIPDTVVCHDAWFPAAALSKENIFRLWKNVIDKMSSRNSRAGTNRYAKGQDVAELFSVSHPGGDMSEGEAVRVQQRRVDG
ncbi:hypothetical protein JCM33374_g2931 [Metschnikowia sp. JCM 33374]|nr:hypothetical protein JCM33374_g2931 [Metschnikowia sp. JCM 33374]